MTGIFSRLSLACSLFVLASCQSPIAQSHIDAHVPDTSSFSRLLERDLKAHFQQELHPSDATRALRVEHRLLRDGPTQTGIAFPKYYVWVKVYADKEVVAEGAVRVAAVDQEKFEVTHFLSSEEIVADADRARKVFPEALHEKIMAHARQANNPAH